MASSTTTADEVEDGSSCQSTKSGTFRGLFKWTSRKSKKGKSSNSTSLNPVEDEEAEVEQAKEAETIKSIGEVKKNGEIEEKKGKLDGLNPFEGDYDEEDEEIETRKEVELEERKEEVKEDKFEAVKKNAEEEEQIKEKKEIKKEPVKKMKDCTDGYNPFEDDHSEDEKIEGLNEFNPFESDDAEDADGESENELDIEKPKEKETKNQTEGETEKNDDVQTHVEEKEFKEVQEKEKKNLKLVEDEGRGVSKLALIEQQAHIKKLSRKPTVPKNNVPFPASFDLPDPKERKGLEKHMEERVGNVPILVELSNGRRVLIGGEFIPSPIESRIHSIVLDETNSSGQLIQVEGWTDENFTKYMDEALETALRL